MKTITKRLYTNESDLEKMIDLVKKRPSSHILSFPSILELQEMLGTVERRANTALWETSDNELVGFAILDKYDNAAYLFEEIGLDDVAEIGAEMIEWGLERLRPFPSHAYQLRIGACPDEVEKVRLLAQYGFALQTWGSVLMERPLSLPIVEPALPAGFTIRPLAGVGEVEAWVTMHQAALGTNNMTVDKRLAMMHTPDYEPALDLVAVASNGTLAAYCNCLISAAENAISGLKLGYTDPIATHPDYQRMGLASALISRGLQLLQERGMQAARLGTSSENHAMQKTAERLGFRVVSKKHYFAKELGTQNV